MSSGLQRRRVAGGGESSLTPSSSRPDLAVNNSFSGRSSPAVPHSQEGMNSIEQQESDHRIAFDPRDMAEGEERLKFPKLTLMEEVLLLGLKDKQVFLCTRNVNHRDTCPSGTTIFRIP
jgi:golgi phosphoprotein 3